MWDEPYHGEHNEVNEREVSSEFLHTIQARLLRGRYFTEAEDASKPNVVIINQALAKQYFPGEDPIGKVMGDTELSQKSLAEIIGVVDDIKEGALDSEIWPAVYYPFNQGPDDFFTVFVRTSQSEQSLLPTLVTAIHGIDPGIAVFDEATMNQRIQNSPSAYLHRTSAWLIGGFAVAGIAVGCGGTLRSGRLFGKPEDARDRSAYGAGCATRRGISAHHERGRMADGHRHRRRTGVLRRRRDLDALSCCLASARGICRPWAGLPCCWLHQLCWPATFRRGARRRLIR